MTDQAYYSENKADAGIEPSRQLTSAIRQTGEIISDLDELSERLAKRLEPIIAHHPEKATEVGDDRATGAPLADEIRSQNDRLATIANRLRYLLDTVQV